MSDSKGSNIIINTGTIVRFFLIAIAIVGVYYVSDVVLVILAAVVIASAIEPVIRRLKNIGVNRVLSVILLYILIAAALGSVVVFFLPSVVKDGVEFLSNLPSTISIESIWSPIRDISAVFGTHASDVSSHGISISDFVNGLQKLVVGTSDSLFQTVSVIFGGAFGFILIVVLSFYLSVRDNGVDDFLRIVTPVRHHEYIINLWRRSQRKIGFWLQGQILLGIVVGLLVYLTLIVVGVPHALVLAVLAGIFEIIPVFGPIISSVPAILIAFSTLGLGKAVLLVGLYLIIYQFESQIFYPLVVKKIVGISPIVVILALVIGAKLAGVLGAIIAVPLSAALMEYISDIERFKKTEIAERAMNKEEGK